jgi:uncharacterized alpha-E superfamily protein
MLSRVADSLYWMSRYMERTDGILRMLKINYASSQDDAQEFSWKPVLRIFTYLDEERSAAMARQTRAVLQYMVTDRENTNSVLNMVTKARENARGVQDHITKELWQCLNDFYHAVREDQLVRILHKEDPISVLDVLIKQGLLYYGITDITMSRGEGFAFLSLGKYLERGVQSADILDVKFSDPQFDFSRTDTTYWKYLLLSISGYELYLKTYRSGFDARNVLEQIVLNEDFPRSVIYSVERLQRYFERLKNDRNKESWKKIDFMIGRINSKVKYSTVDSILRQGLHAYLNGVKEELYEVGNALNQHYFAYI